jgi:adenylate kinase family enzyme
VYGLLKNRLEKADCRLNGFVLEGFPKNENQIKMMDQLEFKLKPNFFVRLKLDDDVSIPCS